MNMIEAELSQLRAQYDKAMSDRETWIRVAACLANAISTGCKVPMLDGHPVVKAAQFMAVPKAWQVSIKPVKIKGASDDPNAPDEDALVVRVEPMKEAPTLVVANGSVR